MCGRFTQYNHRVLLARLFNQAFDDAPPRYNVAPSQPLHDRMRVILAPEHFDIWLYDKSDAAALRAFLIPLPFEQLSLYPVGPLANSSKHQGPELIAPAAEAPHQRTLFD